VLSPRVRIAASLSDCITDAEAVVLATPWPEFATLAAELERTGLRPVIVDCWRMLDPDELAGCTYVPVGSSPAARRDPVVA
jgi:predicted dinucleotide-binding enzyme